MEFYIYYFKFKIIKPIIQIFSFFFKDLKKFNNNDFIYYVDETVDSLSKLLMKFDLHESRERKLSNDLISNMDTIEAGGGIGLMSLYIKRKIRNSKLIILEPNAEFHPLIKKNFTANNYYLENITILNFALSSNNLKKITFIEQQNPFASKVFSNQDVLNYSVKRTEREIETISINRIIEKYSLEEFQLVMDIEGEEYNVLLNDNSWLNKCQCILYECHYKKRDLTRINDFLIKSGFKLTRKTENVFLFKR